MRGGVYWVICGLLLLTLVGCDRGQELSDDLFVKYSDHVVFDMAECAGMYRADNAKGAAEIATAAAIESGKQSYGWSAKETEQEIEHYQRHFEDGTPSMKKVSERCQGLMPLMSRLWKEARNAG